MRHTRTLLIAIMIFVAIAAGYLVYRYGVLNRSMLRTAKEVAEEGVLQELPRSDVGPNAIRMPILIYHNVQPDYAGETREDASFSITPGMLDEQLSYLQQNGYTVISMDDLAADIRAGTTTPIAKPIVLSFDDGWQDQYTYALPLLQKYHDTAIFYIYTDAVSRYPGNMTWAELAELVKDDMEIGDHTESHPHLSGLTQSQLAGEVLGAKAALESHLGIVITHFASPYGYSDESIQAFLKGNGFDTGRTTYKGAHQSPQDQYELRGYLVKRSMREFIEYVSKSY